MYTRHIENQWPLCSFAFVDRLKSIRWCRSCCAKWPQLTSKRLTLTKTSSQGMYTLILNFLWKHFRCVDEFYSLVTDDTLKKKDKIISRKRRIFSCALFGFSYLKCSMYSSIRLWLCAIEPFWLCEQSGREWRRIDIRALKHGPTHITWRNKKPTFFFFFFRFANSHGLWERERVCGAHEILSADWQTYLHMTTALRVSGTAPGWLSGMANFRIWKLVHFKCRIKTEPTRGDWRWNSNISARVLRVAAATADTLDTQLAFIPVSIA